jgi:hypothetical protein
MSRYCRFKDRLITFSICAFGVLAFSTTLNADSTLFPTSGTFTLGNQISNPYYQVYFPNGTNDGSPVPEGPYPGTLTGSPITLFFCLSANLEANWDTSYNGTESVPSGQQQEEAAFLASLFLSDAAANGITLTTSVDSNHIATLNETASPHGTDLSTFINNVQGPITMAIWQVMGTLPTAYGVTQNDPKAQSFVDLAGASYGAFATSMNPYDVVFVPGTSGIQSFIGVSIATPEPSTLFLFGTGALLIALGSARRRAQRPR